MKYTDKINQYKAAILHTDRFRAKYSNRHANITASVSQDH